MKAFKIVIIASCLSVLATLSNCGRNGSKEPYPNYPKVYPSVKNNIN